MRAAGPGKAYTFLNRNVIGRPTEVLSVRDGRETLGLFQKPTEAVDRERRGRLWAREFATLNLVAGRSAQCG